jgi:NitT/TauT family transport system substrate-binding protein
VAHSPFSLIPSASIRGKVGGGIRAVHLGWNAVCSYANSDDRLALKSRKIDATEGAMMTDVLRDTGCAALALALALAMMSLPASADTTLVVGKAAPTADALIAANVGDQLGIFRKHGIDVKIVDFGGGGQMIQAITAGSIDIGDGAGTQMAFIAKGVPMMAVCENSTTLPYFSFGVPWDSPIKSMEELRGKKVGISTAGSLTDWLAQELMRKEGWGPDGFMRVMIGSDFASSTSAFRVHLIDAFIGGTTTFLAMAEQKVGRLLFPVSAYVGKMASGTLFASNHLIATNPDAIRAFLAAWLETTEFMRTHKAETVRIESVVTGFDESVMAKEYDIVIGMFSQDCKFDAESLATLKRSFAELNILSEPPDMSTLYTEAYLPKAPRSGETAP